MELRVLRYFLAVARTENISRAAAEMNISQPALSRQLMDLEEELGLELLVRGKRQTTLTESGYLLKKRAEEITELTQKTVAELTAAEKFLGGDIRIGCGETNGMRLIARALGEIRRDHPEVHCHLCSMDDSGVMEGLDKGVLDFGLLIQPHAPQKYRYIELGHRDAWGILMKKGSPLAGCPRITPADIADKPLIVSRQALKNSELSHWFGQGEEALNIVATYTLVYNAALMAEEGIGYVLCLDKLVRTDGDSPLTFRPLSPRLTNRLFFIWKSGQIFSRAASLLREKLAQ